jgi:hypothetical protein
VRQFIIARISPTTTHTQVSTTRTRTQPGIRGARRLAPLATTPTTQYHMHRIRRNAGPCIEAYGITLFPGLNDPGASATRPSSPSQANDNDKRIN